MYFKLIDKNRKDSYVDIFKAPRGSQIVYCKIEDIVEILNDDRAKMDN